MTSESALSFKNFYPEQKTTLIFLHGGGAAGWMWQPVVDRLSEFHCLVPDLPEHGESMQVKPFIMRLAAEKCIELIRSEAHDKKAVVIGLSEGAQTAVEMLAIAPEVIEKAVISSALLLPMPGSKMYSSPGLIAALFKISVPPFRNNDWWIRINMKHAAGIPDEFFPQFKQNFQTMPESQFVNLMVANQTYRMPDGLEKVKVPVLVVCGKHEYAAMKNSSQQLAAVLQNSTLAEIDLGQGSGMAKEHNWAMTAPEEFASMIRLYLQDAALPPVLTQVQKK